MSRLSDAAAHPFRKRGFTLIELLIAIAILAIIMGIAIPSYNQWVLKSGRAEAKSVLFSAAQTLERCFTRFSVYDNINCGLQSGATELSENEKYQLSVAATTATTFSLTATPQGSQTNDSDCPSFGLDQSGQRYVDGGTDADKLDECW